MPDWNPELYLRFVNERTQPVKDLVAHIDLQGPTRVLDLGCGPGNSTAVLKHRWPDASVLGLDRSAAMIAKAKSIGLDVQWVHADAGASLTHLGPLSATSRRPGLVRLQMFILHCLQGRQGADKA